MANVVNDTFAFPQFLRQHSTESSHHIGDYAVILLMLHLEPTAASALYGVECVRPNMNSSYWMLVHQWDGATNIHDTLSVKANID